MAQPSRGRPSTAGPGRHFASENQGLGAAKQGLGVAEQGVGSGKHALGTTEKTVGATYLIAKLSAAKQGLRPTLKKTLTSETGESVFGPHKCE